MVTFIALSFSSCSGLRQVSGVQSTSFAPDCVRVEANIGDYVQLGETVVTVESRKYLGCINKIDKIKSTEELNSILHSCKGPYSINNIEKRTSKSGVRLISEVNLLRLRLI